LTTRPWGTRPSRGHGFRATPRPKRVVPADTPTPLEGRRTQRRVGKPVWGEKRNGEKDKRGRFNENRRKKRKTATPKRLKHQKIPNH
ncbi:MAG: hypothetical protein ACTSV0_02600, partial [Candidatus Freyarchaeota archaeon]